MRIRIDHLTQYDYAPPARSIIQILRMTPVSDARQTISDWRIDVDCDARLSPFTDAFGNPCHTLSIDRPVSRLRIETAGQVDTWPSSGAVAGTAEPLPEAVFLRTTPLTAADAAIRAFALDLTAGATDPLEKPHRLLAGIWREIRFDTGATSTHTDAATAFADRRGVCQDLAQIFIAAARALGVPARYVSGHLLRRDGTDAQEAAHAWAEAHVAGLGWVSFDPANGISADEHYVRVAIGLDYRDAAPVSGARYGGGAETLAVGLRVREHHRQMQGHSQ